MRIIVCCSLPKLSLLAFLPYEYFLNACITYFDLNIAPRKTMLLLGPKK